MPPKRLYIPTSSASLPHYWGSGLIMPPILFSKSIEKAQVVPSALILVETMFAFNANCSLEVVLTEKDERDLIKLKNGVYQLKGCLPVTRIINIYFQKEEQLKTTIWNINQGSAFVPERLLKVVSENEISQNEIILDSEVGKNVTTQILIEKTNRYNVILGGLAFMRLAYEGVYKYSENYFATLGYFNTGIANRVAWYKHNKGLAFNERYIDLFTTKDSEWSKWRNYIYHSVDVSQVEELAKSEGVRAERSLSGFKMNNISAETILYDIALLATYGENKQKSLEDLIQFVSANNIEQIKLEEIALLFGLQTGYSRLRNRYKIKGKEVDVKFRFENQLDYSIVESVFEFVFYGKNFVSSFSHLEDILPKTEVSQSGVPENGFMVLDVIAISKKKSQDGNAYSNLSRDSFFRNIATAIYKWGIPYDNEQNMLLKAEQFLKSNFEKDLEAVINTERSTVSPNKTINSNVGKQGVPEEAKNEVKEKPEKSSSDISSIKKHENKTWADLKKIAGTKGITVPKGKKGTLKDILALIEQIEATKTIV